MNRRRFLMLSAGFACAPHLAQAGVWHGRALGADVSIRIDGPRAEVEALLSDIPARLNAIEDRFSLFRAGSLLARLNAAGHLDTEDAEFHRMMHLCAQMHRATGGLFDPTVQPLWQAGAAGHETGKAQRAVGWDRVHHGATRIALAPDQALTFNGIAQGFATDRIVERLTKAGAERMLVNIGEYRAAGGPFRLGLSDPEHGPIGLRSLSDGAIATSSPRVSGIVGPQGETPLWSTVSVEAPTAAIADAASTAASLMPAPKLLAMKDTLGLTRITTVTRDGTLRSL